MAGPDEYIIKSGDTFAKIARAHGSSISDIQAVNPGVDSSKLKIGQKIKMPKK
ncbi:MAG: LysM peptidoglycan-binding domain-containing protein [Opitutaceae bacterium]|nr:LysM peptidoglycan-binding domain-containing protein [Opitutaceae bacterium]